jgi:hypothetical protein
MSDDILEVNQGIALQLCVKYTMELLRIYEKFQKDFYNGNIPFGCLGLEGSSWPSVTCTGITVATGITLATTKSSYPI